MRKSILFSVYVYTLLLLPLSQAAHAQYIKASVSVNVDKLHQDQQIKLQNFAGVVQQYIESNLWSQDKNAFGDIAVSITIVIDNVRSSFEDVYSARFFIVSTTGFQDADKEWRFPYMQNQSLLFDPNLFDGLTGLIDFYIYILIGEEVDKYEPYAGTPYFNKALQICQLGKSDRYNRWWDKREQLIRKYLRESHKPFRNMTSWYYAAHYWTLEDNREEAKNAADEVMKLLKEITNTPEEREFLLNFFKKEHQNLALVFFPYQTLFNELITLDPERKEFYLNYRKK